MVEPGALDGSVIHVHSVERPEISDPELAVGAIDESMPARHGRVVQRQRGAGAADLHRLMIDNAIRPGARTARHHEHRLVGKEINGWRIGVDTVRVEPVTVVRDQRRDDPRTKLTPRTIPLRHRCSVPRQCVVVRLTDLLQEICVQLLTYPERDHQHS